MKFMAQWRLMRYATTLTMDDPVYRSEQKHYIVWYRPWLGVCWGGGGGGGGDNVPWLNHLNTCGGL